MVQVEEPEVVSRVAGTLVPQEQPAADVLHNLGQPHSCWIQVVLDLHSHASFDVVDLDCDCFLQ